MPTYTPLLLLLLLLLQGTLLLLLLLQPCSLVHCRCFRERCCCRCQKFILQCLNCRHPASRQLQHMKSISSKPGKIQQVRLLLLKSIASCAAAMVFASKHMSMHLYQATQRLGCCQLQQVNSRVGNANVIHCA
jgi:hypothetical protein